MYDIKIRKIFKKTVWERHLKQVLLDARQLPTSTDLRDTVNLRRSFAFSCPYDSLTIYDGSSPTDPIVRRLCGLQQRLEVFSFGSELLLEFNTTEPPMTDMRGYLFFNILEIFFWH